MKKILIQNKIMKCFYNNQLLYEFDIVHGKNGYTNNKREGDMKTPIGNYKIINSFGINNNPGTNLDYYKLKGNEEWIDDPESIHYNTMQYSKGNWTSSEKLYNESIAYKYVIVFNYNIDPIEPFKGSAVFIHCKTKKDYTAGCIALNEDDMILLLKWVDNNTEIEIKNKLIVI